MLFPKAGFSSLHQPNNTHIRVHTLHQTTQQCTLELPTKQHTDKYTNSEKTSDKDAKAFLPSKNIRTMLAPPRYCSQNNENGAKVRAPQGLLAHLRPMETGKASGSPHPNRLASHPSTIRKHAITTIHIHTHSHTHTHTHIHIHNTCTLHEVVVDGERYQVMEIGSLSDMPEVGQTSGIPESLIVLG
ncbi:unnamed protein product [Brugia pahangi]|uniref:Uncharacterized protein n=1 Tax=Brugia pahangi TaxID=6280 RepID=A0A0N4T5G7_BRUPA|nr:unnamed protein product [Brugia pahangi]